MLILQSLHPRSRRNLTVENGLRDMVVNAQNPDLAQKLLTETRDFMRASRIHSVSLHQSHRHGGPLVGNWTRWLTDPQELLKRYTPLADMSESEKIHASARKVGLETPIKYKRPDSE
jgi:ATP synthase assembly factor FMC1